MRVLSVRRCSDAKGVMTTSLAIVSESLAADESEPNVNDGASRPRDMAGGIRVEEEGERGGRRNALARTLR